MIVTQPKEVIADFVCAAQGIPNEWSGNYSALARVKEGRIVAGLLYSDYRPPNIVVHIGTTLEWGWLNRELLFAIFDYPFNYLNLSRMTAPIVKSNHRCREFVEHLGFKLEGNVRRAWNGQDLLIYGILKDECKWHLKDTYGQRSRRRIREEQ